jgi:hypothetical protein
MVGLGARDNGVDQVLSMVERYGVLKQGACRCHAGWPDMGALTDSAQRIR